MKRLLVLLVIAPVILYGQTRQIVVIDSIRSAENDLQRVSKIVGSSSSTRVTNIQVSDSGEYVTLVVRLHVKEPIAITAVPVQPVVNIKTGKIVVDGPAVVAVPPLPPPISGLPLSPFPVYALSTGSVPVMNITEVTVPPVLNVMAGVLEAIPVPAVALFRIKDIVVPKLDTVEVPPMPELQLGIIDPVPLSAFVYVDIKDIPARKLDTIPVPVFEEKRMPVEGMHLSDEGYSLLEKLEGFSPELYSLGDGGLTIGFGFFIPNDEISKWSKGVTWEEAERIIRQKVPLYEDQVKQYINVPLTQKEFDALTMLAYNLGGFAKATSIVNDINGYADFEQLQSDWKRFVHSKAPGVMKGLMNRRRDELDVRNASNYQPERKIQVFKSRR